MAIEVVEVQVRVENVDPWVNSRGLVMVGVAAAIGKYYHHCLFKTACNHQAVLCAYEQMNAARPTFTHSTTLTI